MFLAGAKNLERSRDWINELNVFPVPDGDTGTNMSMTIMAAADEVRALEDVTMAKLCKAMSSGSLRGARGNSGVILSQLLRGFCKAIRDEEELKTDILCLGFEKATETAYKAVMKPKEGTILTVARAFTEEARSLYEQDPEISMENLLSGALSYAEEVLSQTPEMLPVLKEAGVVDSGGQGLIEILKGAYDVYLGKEELLSDLEEPETKDTGKETANVIYCLRMTMKMAEGREEAFQSLKQFLNPENRSVIWEQDGIIHVHSHLEHPGELIEKAIGLGTVCEVTLEGVSGEKCRFESDFTAHDAQEARCDEKTTSDKDGGEPQNEMPHKEVGFVAVAAGNGLCSIFRDLGADGMIEGGQTMNPSTEDVINAIRQVNADTVFVFPNNKNIILAASQAQTMIKDRKVIVIPTKTVPQGITALISYLPDLSPEENEKQMYEEIRKVKTCSLTYAVRDTHIGGKDIHEGDIMGVGDKGILAVGKDILETSVEAACEMTSEDSELITIYYGEDVTAEDAQIVADRVAEKCPDCEVELNRGDQPVYYYIISVE